MKVIKFLGAAFLCSFAIVSCSNEQLDQNQEAALTAANKSASNNDLVGAHYNLNIIGVPNEKTADMTSGNGHVIFVGLGSSKQGDEALTTRIYLSDSAESEDSDADFRVLDANGTDGEAAFELPKPGYDAYVVGEEDVVMSDYSIFVRPLGKPGGWSTITTCADLMDQDGLFGMLGKADQKTIKNAVDSGTGAYCSVEQVGADVTMRTKGKTSWTNVTAELTSIVFKIEVWIDESGDGIVDEGEITIEYIRVPIFDDMLDNEYWKYDNNGLKLLQVRFYPFGTNIADADDPSSWE